MIDFYQSCTTGGLYVALIDSFGNLIQLFKWGWRKRTFRKYHLNCGEDRKQSYFRNEFWKYDPNWFLSIPITSTIQRKAKRCLKRI
jgi:hypothetical protein